MKFFLHLRPKYQLNLKHLYKMKLKSIFAAAALSVALISCGPKAKPLSEQLVGQWTGVDSVQLTVKDSLGVDSTTNFTLPIEFNYFEDSTFTAVLKVNDSTSVSFGGVATVKDSSATFTTSVACGTMTFAVEGTLSIANDVLTVNCNGVAEGATRVGKATLTRKVEEQAAPAEQPAAQPAEQPADTTKKAQ